ncbi:MAG: substrate-binding domain-containing protein [Clostridium sp.]|nr:substrate-binding domain-containing protein [Clostridium sp.]
MKNGKKLFIIMEMMLTVIVVILAVFMFKEQNGKKLKKVAVIIQNSDDNQWSAFRYGLKMAAQDCGVELFIVSIGEVLTVEEEINVIQEEIENGADAVIVQPVADTGIGKMLKKIENKVPVMLVESAVLEEWELAVVPVTEPDNYAMGKKLAEELLKDYNENIKEKTVGIVVGNEDSEASVNRRRGVEEVLQKSEVKINWILTGFSAENRKELLQRQPKVDIVVALDNDSLVTAGECSAANDLHGALVYGIGNSTGAIYYLDTGIAECLIVPDEFNVGYQSVTEVAECFRHYLYQMKDQTVSHTVIRREDLFSPQNQEIIFTMSQ